MFFYCVASRKRRRDARGTATVTAFGAQGLRESIRAFGQGAARQTTSYKPGSFPLFLKEHRSKTRMGAAVRCPRGTRVRPHPTHENGHWQVVETVWVSWRIRRDIFFAAPAAQRMVAALRRDITTGLGVCGPRGRDCCGFGVAAAPRRAKGRGGVPPGLYPPAASERNICASP
jgi:hypothetical protein